MSVIPHLFELTRPTDEISERKIQTHTDSNAY